MNCRRFLLAGVFGAVGLLCQGQTASAQGTTIEVFPGTNTFSQAAENLAAGDTLIVHEGTYNETVRMSLQVQGTVADPVVIMGAEGEGRPVITRPDTASIQNTINIEGNTTHLTIRGLEIVGNGGDGVNMNGTISEISLEDLVIHDVDVGINFRSSMDAVTVRRNHIYNTGVRDGTGEGMYVGCHTGSCSVSNSLIEGNWIHDSLPGTTQGDGIEIKVGSWGNVVRDNVIYNRAYPGILVYGTGGLPPNVIEGNVVWNALEGISALSDAVVRNNIVMTSGSGVGTYSHQVVSQRRDVIIVNNTLYDNDDGLYLRWSGTNLVVANNAVYSPGRTAVDGAVGGGGTALANYVEGGMSGSAIDNVAFFSGGTTVDAFVDAGAMNLWPRTGSVLLGSADSNDSPALDFNGTARVLPIDVGAYETNGLNSNPGWAITEGFKSSATPPPDPPVADTIPPTVTVYID